MAKKKKTIKSKHPDLTWLIIIVFLIIACCVAALIILLNRDRNEPVAPPTDLTEAPSIREQTDNTDSPTEPSTAAIPTEVETTKIEYKYDIEKYKSNGEWSLILANPTNYLPEGYSFELANVQGKYEMDQRAAYAAKDMISAAAEEGVTLTICSAYRSHERQTTNFRTKLQSFLDEGMEYDAAYARTARIIAIPGTSEHETGLALDIVTPSYVDLDAGYANTDAAKWLYDNAKYFGFILRYPSDKEDITKIMFEPWHYRFVGTEYSIQIMDAKQCLEEFLNKVN